MDCQPTGAVKLEFHTDIPLLVSHLEHIDPAHGSGDVDQGVDAAKPVQRLFHNGFGRRGRHQVEFEHERLGANCFDLLANLTQFLSTASRKGDCAEVAGQTKRCSLADARTRASDDRHRFRHVLSLPVLRVKVVGHSLAHAQERGLRTVTRARDRFVR
jgi:hypothetical protein